MERKRGWRRGKKGLGVSGISRTFSFCEDKSAALLLSSPARSWREGRLAIPPSPSPFPSSLASVSSEHYEKGCYGGLLWKIEKRDNNFSWSDSHPCESGRAGVSFPLSLPGNRFMVCQAVSRSLLFSLLCQARFVPEPNRTPQTLSASLRGHSAVS